MVVRIQETQPKLALLVLLYKLGVVKGQFGMDMMAEAINIAVIDAMDGLYRKMNKDMYAVR